VQVHLWVKKPDECDTAKFFDTMTMISDGIIVDARAEENNETKHTRGSHAKNCTS
jgi:hypothetical protein